MYWRLMTRCVTTCVVISGFNFIVLRFIQVVELNLLMDSNLNVNIFLNFSFFKAHGLFLQ